MRKHSSLVLLIAVMLMGLVLMACGDSPISGDSKSSDKPDSTASSTATSNGVTIDKLVADVQQGKITVDEALESAKLAGINADQLKARLGQDQVKVVKLEESGSDKPAPKYTGKHRQPAVDFNIACGKPFTDTTTWILCEPGALQFEPGAFRFPEAEGVAYRSNCPEGFFWYGSMGQGKITTVGKDTKNFPDATITLQPAEATNYLVIIRCPLNDAKVDSDRNMTLRITDIVVGHAAWAPVNQLGNNKKPVDAAYVSAEWFGEQLVVSGNNGGTNCGATGCSNTIVVLWDLDSGLEQRFHVTSIKGETGDADGDGITDYTTGNWKLLSSNQ